MSVQGNVRLALGCITAFALLARPVVAGDARHALQTLDSLEQFLKEGTPGGLQHAQDSVAPIETDLEGLDEATKGPLLKRLEEEKKKIAAAVFAVEQKRYASRFEAIMNNARRLVAPEMENVRAELASTPQDLDRAEKALASADAAKFLDEPARKKFAAELLDVRAKLAEKNVRQNLAFAQDRVASVERRLPEFLKSALQAETNNTPEILDSSARSLGNQIDGVSQMIAAMPPAHPEVKKIAERLKAASESYESALVRVQGKDALSTLKRDWESRLPQAEGWQSETAGIGLAQFVGESSEKTANLGAPRSVQMVLVANGWLRKFFGAPYAEGTFRRADTYRAFLRDPQIKALYDQVTQQRDAAEAQVLAFAVSLLAEAEKATLNSDGRQRFKTLIERTLPDSLADSPKFKPALERIKALAQ